LLLKGVIKEDDWHEIKDAIEYVWTRDSYFAELKQNEILRERLEVLSSLDEYIGKYFSNEWVRKNVLRQSEDDIEEMDKQIKDETGEDPNDAEINPDLLDFQDTMK
jgi:hypothetical protein